MNAGYFHSVFIKFIYFSSRLMFLQCIRKKRPKCFCNIFYKTRAILMKLEHIFLDKFAAISCKRFPPRVNDVSTIPCET